MAWLYLNKETGETLGRWRGGGDFNPYKLFTKSRFAFPGGNEMEAGRNRGWGHGNPLRDAV